MKLLATAQAGSLESSDLLVVVNPVEAGSGRKIELESAVIKAYGGSIKKDIESVLDALHVKDIHLTANDRGALTPTIKARVETAVLRAASKEA